MIMSGLLLAPSLAVTKAATRPQPMASASSTMFLFFIVAVLKVKRVKTFIHGPSRGAGRHCRGDRRPRVAARIRQPWHDHRIQHRSQICRLTGAATMLPGFLLPKQLQPRSVVPVFPAPRVLAVLTLLTIFRPRRVNRLNDSFLPAGMYRFCRSDAACLAVT